MEQSYRKVKGIVGKASRTYYIKDWEESDWHQEGMLCLYLLLRDHPELAENDQRLCVYFKVRFTNYIKDLVRRQESQKRRFDRMPYEEISSIGFSISDGIQDPAERMIYRQLLEEFRTTLSGTEQAQYDQLIQGESFRGRQSLLRKLRTFIGD